MYKFCIFIVILLLCSQYSAAETKPIIIGLNADMSAVAAEGGKAIRRGALIAIDEINARGGVLDRPLALEVRDHRGNPARGLSNIKLFAANDDVVAVLGGIHTPVVMNELEEVHKQKLLYLIPWAAGTTIVDNGFSPNYIFRLSVRDQHAGDVLIRHAKKRNFSKIGLLLEHTAWGRSNEQSMNTAAQQQGLQVVQTEWFNWRTDSLKDQVESLYKAGSEVILLVANAPEGATLVKTLVALEKSHQLPVLSHWGISSGKFVKQSGLDNLKKLDISILQTYTFLKPVNVSKQRSVLKAYQEKFNAEATAETITAPPGVAHAYDLVHMLVAAIKSAESLNSEKLRIALENIDQYEGLFKNFKRPFSKDKRDALTTDDYILARFNENGYLEPIL